MSAKAADGPEKGNVPRLPRQPLPPRLEEDLKHSKYAAAAQNAASYYKQSAKSTNEGKFGQESELSKKKIVAPARSVMDDSVERAMYDEILGTSRVL